MLQEHPFANCHPSLHRCMCGPREKVGPDGDSCVDRRQPVHIVPRHDEVQNGGRHDEGHQGGGEVIVAHNQDSVMAR